MWIKPLAEGLCGLKIQKLHGVQGSSNSQFPWDNTSSQKEPMHRSPMFRNPLLAAEAYRVPILFWKEF